MFFQKTGWFNQQHIYVVLVFGGPGEALHLTLPALEKSSQGIEIWRPKTSSWLGVGLGASEAVQRIVVEE